MYRYYCSILLLSITSINIAFAQNEKRRIKQHIVALSSSGMHGRGYVNKGGDKAANYIRRHFREFGLLPFDKDSSYFQYYTMPVNTFPGEVSVIINKKELKPGADYLVQGASSAYHSDKKVKLKHVDLSNIKDSASWQNVRSTFVPGKAYYLKGADTVSKYMKLSIRTFAEQLPKNLFIVPKHGKLIWTANMDTVAATLITVEDTVLPIRVRKATVNVDTKFIPAFENKNVIAYIPGTVHPDSFIAFTAHYDHLGRMGREALFPGAHDNASGTSLVLYLAQYFSAHPQPYSIAFMLFSGEEAGLVGSKEYVKAPQFPLQQIRMVVNLDMTGDATNGITVVNGDTRPVEFGQLEQINTQRKYLPKINKREQTQNSDHYSFSKEGVPAVFIYGNGTKGHYHDIFDVAKELNLEHIDGLAKLLIDFTGVFSGGEKPN